jgi:hypothetical protein
MRAIVNAQPKRYVGERIITVLYSCTKLNRQEVNYAVLIKGQHPG